MSQKKIAMAQAHAPTGSHEISARVAAAASCDTVGIGFGQQGARGHRLLGCRAAAAKQALQLPTHAVHPRDGGLIAGMAGMPR